MDDKNIFNNASDFSGAFFYPQNSQTLQLSKSHTLQPNQELFPAIRYYSSRHCSPTPNPPILQPNCGVTATIGAMGFLFERNYLNKSQRLQLIYQKKNIFDIIKSLKNKN
ncbi:hypothetical protein PQ459_17375 [Chryseobacterium sp. KACC 21268]|nr:hypothetical protein PQ459_17375 [Chryseobacterium sp. KACC 21268]